MRSLILFYLLLGFSLFISAQDRPPFLPEDVAPKTLNLSEFSKPGILNKSRSRGIELSFIQVGGMTLLNEDDKSIEEGKIKNIKQMLLKVKAPLVNKEDLRILLGYSYRPEQYNFSSFGNDYAPVFQHMDGRWLKSQQSTLFVNKSINEKSYLTVMARIAFNGDYEKFLNLNKEYQVLTFSGIYGFKRSENTEWGIGFVFSHSFRSTIALPTFMYQNNFNDKFGIELLLPAIALGRWNINKSTILLFGAEYNSKSFALHVPGDTGIRNYGMNHSEFRFPIRLERQIHSWFWVGAQAGYQYNFSTDFDANNDASFKVEAKSAPYFKIGLFLSPPDDIE